MTPDLLEQGARRVEQHMAALHTGKSNTESGGRNASAGRIITGQQGYKLADHATAAEITHASAWLISQGKEMIRRGIKIRARAHQQLR